MIALQGDSIPARRLANAWLKQTGGGTAEKCAAATGLLVDVVREALDGLRAERIVGTGRKLSFRPGNEPGPGVRRRIICRAAPG